MIDRSSPNVGVHECLKVGTFNVRWACPDDGPNRWERRRPRFMALLQEWEPDLLGLQEPVRAQLDAIQSECPELQQVGIAREDGRESGEYCPILFRVNRLELLEQGTFWLSDTPELPGSRSWGNRVTRICTWARLRDRRTQRTFMHYNTHLDHEVQDARERGISLVLERMRQAHQDEPMILTGDFNAWPDNPALRMVRQPHSPVPVDAALAADPAATQGTFHGFTGEAEGERIDYLFLSTEWQVQAASVWQYERSVPYPSDHFPVAATLCLAQEQQK